MDGTIGLQIVKNTCPVWMESCCKKMNNSHEYFANDHVTEVQQQTQGPTQ
uniref:Uncharacterized protein n=1 Tax=Tetranychus urticae TaxID=32264 RepID=T1JPX0_TETUR